MYIKEFEDVLISFSHMKESLKASLEQQWKSEQMQKEQIAALARNPVPRPGAAQLIARHIIAPLRRSVSRLLPVPHAPR